MGVAICRAAAYAVEVRAKPVKKKTWFPYILFRSTSRFIFVSTKGVKVNQGQIHPPTHGDS